MVAPLAIPPAVEGLLWLLGIGSSAVIASQTMDATVIEGRSDEDKRIRGSARDAARAAAKAQACSDCPPPECDETIRRMRALRDELKRREAEMYVDQHRLYDVFLEKGPEFRVPKHGHWTGHIKQFKEKQSSLRGELKLSKIMNCPQPSDLEDVWFWASKKPIDKPALFSTGPGGL